MSAERILKVGDVMVSEPNIFYGPHIAGPEGCTTFEIFSNHAASHEAVLDLAGTTVKFDVAKPGEFKRMMEAQREAENPPLDRPSSQTGRSSMEKVGLGRQSNFRGYSRYE